MLRVFREPDIYAYIVHIFITLKIKRRLIILEKYIMFIQFFSSSSFLLAHRNTKGEFHANGVYT